jgi:hypothetical protein
MAEELKRPAVAEKPAGLRVMSGGHSWSTEDSAPLCQAAGITGHMIPKAVENRTINGNGKAWQNDSDLENLSWPGNWKS